MGLYLGLNWAVMVLWQQWMDQSSIEPFKQVMQGYCILGPLMESCFGEPLKRINALNPAKLLHGDIVITHYGLESGVIYKLGRALRE